MTMVTAIPTITTTTGTATRTRRLTGRVVVRGLLPSAPEALVFEDLPVALVVSAEGEVLEAVGACFE